MNAEIKNLLIYISKCVTGCVLVFVLSWIFDYHDFNWCIISVMLVLTPDNKEAVSLALTRIKANLIGGGIALLLLCTGIDNVITISIAITLTIILCYFFKLMAGSRTALAAVIIVMLHGLENNEKYFWSTTLERITSVIVGCIIGLLITMAFHKKLHFGKQTVAVKKKDEEA